MLIALARALEENHTQRRAESVIDKGYYDKKNIFSFLLLPFRADPTFSTQW